jgi:hypothetical protein
VAIDADVRHPLSGYRTHVLHICLSAVVPMYGTGSDPLGRVSKTEITEGAETLFEKEDLRLRGNRTRPAATARSLLNATVHSSRYAERMFE